MQTLESLFVKANIQAASTVIPKSTMGNPASHMESVEFHDMALRHYLIVLDHESSPTEDNRLWYNGHFGMTGGSGVSGEPSTMLLNEDILKQYKDQLYRFAHENIAAFNLAQIETGLAVIAALKEAALAKKNAEAEKLCIQATGVVVLSTTREDVSTVPSNPHRQTGHRLVL